MKSTQPTAVRRHLAWLLAQTLLLLPMAVGPFYGMSEAHVGVWLLKALLSAVIGFIVVRNVVRLWRAPPAEAGAWTAIPQLIVGALFLLLSSGPLIESDRLSTKPLGLALLIIGASLVLLGLRDVLRIRSRRAAQPAL
ncbi:hypothetical protein [Nocardioides sp.]|uniref:hypothetical protein n=1 Tax=Nocardioides sp. TaxID=35761 RepID=UPI00273306D0|nr:hypothetical protein [Nocardioides sp.]MDP3894509.1 hypothetical protein [Nocardioides sp.]